MSTVSKRDIVKAIAENMGLPVSEVADVVQTFMNQLVDELSRGHRLEFREFGIFDLKERKARKARNPRTGAEVYVDAKTVVVFKPGKHMKEKVDQKMRARLGDRLGLDGSAAAKAATNHSPAAANHNSAATNKTGVKKVAKEEAVNTP